METFKQELSYSLPSNVSVKCFIQLEDFSVFIINS